MHCLQNVTNLVTFIKVSSTDTLDTETHEFTSEVSNAQDVLFGLKKDTEGHQICLVLHLCPKGHSLLGLTVTDYCTSRQEIMKGESLYIFLNT